MIEPKRIERLWNACPELRPLFVYIQDGDVVLRVTIIDEGHVYNTTTSIKEVTHALIRDKIVWWLAARQDAPSKLFPPKEWGHSSSQDAFDDAVAVAHREGKYMIGPFTESGSCPSDCYTTFEPIGQFDDPTEACVLAAERVLGLPEWKE